MRLGYLGLFAACAGFVLGAGECRAGQIYSFSEKGYSASADFELSGNVLTVLLTNLADLGGNKAVPTDVLTGLTFSTSSQLTPVSVSAPKDTTVWFGTASNPGDGWGYGYGGDYHGLNNVVTSSGAFKGVGHSSFPNPAAVGSALQGLDYGILTDNFSGNANGGAKHGPLFENSLLFTFTALKDFTLSQLGSSVIFQYGTSTSEPSFTGTLESGPTAPSAVPEPSSIALLGLGGIGLMIGAYRRRASRLA